MNPLATYFLNQPLELSRAGAAALARLLASESTSLPSVAMAEQAQGDDRPDYNRPYRFSADWKGDPEPRPYDIGSWRIIPIIGMTTRGLGNWATYAGFADYDKLLAWIEQAANDERIEAVALCIDSPGGHAVGNTEVAEAIAAMAERKPVIAWTGGVMASAAYKIAAGCTAIYAAPSAIVGSIGTYAYTADATVYWKDLGVEWLVFRSGEHKGAGIDGWTDSQKAAVQAEIEDRAEDFRAHVRRYRTGIGEEDMQGQTFTGREAVRRGFAAATANTLHDALDQFAVTTTTTV